MDVSTMVRYILTLYGVVQAIVALTAAGRGQFDKATFHMMWVLVIQIGLISMQKEF